MLIKIYKDKIKQKKSSLNNVSESSEFSCLLFLPAFSCLLEFLLEPYFSSFLFLSPGILRVAKSSQNYSPGYYPKSGFKRPYILQQLRARGRNKLQGACPERVPHTGPRHGACPERVPYTGPRQGACC